LYKILCKVFFIQDLFLRMLQRGEQCGVTLALNFIKLTGEREEEGVMQQREGLQIKVLFLLMGRRIDESKRYWEINMDRRWQGAKITLLHM